MFKNSDNLLVAEQAIALAIDSISSDIRTSTNPEENLTRAEAIKRLADAFGNLRE